MCDLCSDYESGKRKALFVAEQLDRLSQAYRDMAYRKISPHGDAVKPIGALAKSIVRELVQEWV